MTARQVTVTALLVFSALLAWFMWSLWGHAAAPVQVEAESETIGLYVEEMTAYETGRFLAEQHDVELATAAREEARRVEAERAEAESKLRRRNLELRQANARRERTTTTTAAHAPSTGRCGGDLPPCWVMQRESGGNIHAYNADGCGGRGCRGKWQCDPRTCSGTGTEAQQDAEARALWDGGRGCQHWTAC